MELSERWQKWLTAISGLMVVVQAILGVFLLNNGDTETAVVLFSTITLWASSLMLMNIEKFRY